MRARLSLGLAIAMAVMPAEAQINPFRGESEGLSKEDLSLLNEAAEDLYETSPGSVGRAAEWRNSQSGNAGRVTLLKVYEFKGMPCKQVRHDIKLRNRADLNRFVIDSCRVSDGSWKIR